MKSFENLRQKGDFFYRFRYLIYLFAIFLAIAGFVAYCHVDSFISSQIKKQIPIVRGTDAYKKWEKLAVPLTMRFFFFNITNADRVLNHGDLPELQQVGPYVFLETRFKTNIRFSNEGRHVLYHEAKQYYFEPEKSSGSLDDIVIVPSVPEVAMATKLLKKAQFVPALSSMLYSILNSALRNTPLFAPHRVGDLLFDGYEVSALKKLLSLISGIPNNPIQLKSPLPNNRFGFFYLKNGTEDPDSREWRVHTGLGDATRYGQVISYDESSENQCWRKSYYCNAMLGTDGSSFPPDLDTGNDHPAGRPAVETQENLFKRAEGSQIEEPSNEDNPFIGRGTISSGSLEDHLLNIEHSSVDISGKRRLFVYNPDIYRWVYLTYERPSMVRGIPAYRYTLPDLFYTAPSDAPENACFCTKHSQFNLKIAIKNFLSESLRDRNATSPLALQSSYRKTFPAQCRLHGILDISHCRQAPIIVSAPHFYKGDPLLIHSVRGLSPRENLHKTYVDVEPRTGIVINAARRAQINIELTSHPSVEMLSSVDKVINQIKYQHAAYHSGSRLGEYSGLILPVLWLEETAQVDEANANLLKSKLFFMISLLDGLTLFLTGLGIILFTFTFILNITNNCIWVNPNRRVPTADPDAHQIPEKAPTH